jgi:hypothetical protein
MPRSRGYRSRIVARSRLRPPPTSTTNSPYLRMTHEVFEETRSVGVVERDLSSPHRVQHVAPRSAGPSPGAPYATEHSSASERSAVARPCRALRPAPGTAGRGGGLAHETRSRVQAHRSREVRRPAGRECRAGSRRRSLARSDSPERGPEAALGTSIRLAAPEVVQGARPGI